MLLGDARSGKLADNLAGFGRMLRRAGVTVDSSRIVMAGRALAQIDIGNRQDVHAALSAVLVSRHEDQHVFDDLFSAYFRNPEIAKQLMAQLLPQAKAESTPPSRSARAQEALQAPRLPSDRPQMPEDKVELDAAMSASDRARLRHADFNQLSASEFRLIERLVRDIPLPIPTVASRQRSAAVRGDQLDWRQLLRLAARHDGELIEIAHERRRQSELPLLVLVDVSGSMERYARLMLAFLHQATHRQRRLVFAFGTHLTDLNAAFRERDTDIMLREANEAIADFGGGTKLGESLKTLHQNHRRAVVGNRTIVLLITDGLDTGDHDELAKELRWLTRQARATVWLNPLLRFDGYQPIAGGASVLKAHVDGMLAIHNLEHLSKLAHSLAQLFKKLH